MSMISSEYHKINTVFYRNAKGKVEDYATLLPLYKDLLHTKWRAEEKVDGTNIRVEIRRVEGDYIVSYGGRTNNADIPSHLMDYLTATFDNVDYSNVFDWSKTDMVTLYGEGYGHKIQNGGDYLPPNSVGFILFDICIGGYFMSREFNEEIASALHIPIVPVIGYMTIPEAIEYVRSKPQSTISYKEKEMEGLVLKLDSELKDRNGNRITAKVKCCDF